MKISEEYCPSGLNLAPPAAAITLIGSPGPLKSLMRNRYLPITLSMMVPFQVSAMSLGNITVESGFSEPLQARIALPAVSWEEARNLKVGLAPAPAFARMGLERMEILDELEFKIRRTNDGGVYIDVSSQSVVDELFLAFIVEIEAPNGRISRGYDLLLEPPMLAQSDTGVIEVVKPPEPAKTAAPVVKSRDFSKLQRHTDGTLSFGPIGPGDTLSQVAQTMFPGGKVSIWPVMLGLYEQNPQAFQNADINLLKAGSRLSLRDQDKVLAVSRAQAREILLSPQPAGAQERQVAQAVEDVGDVPPVERKLVIAGTEAVGDGPVNMTDLREELTLTREAADELREENVQLRDRVAAYEKQVMELKAQIERQSAAAKALMERSRTLPATTGADSGFGEKTLWLTFAGLMVAILGLFLFANPERRQAILERLRNIRHRSPKGSVHTIWR